MKKIILSSFFLHFMLIFSGCEKKPGSLVVYEEVNGPILFAQCYINFAWGYQYSGWYVDSEGQVYEFNEQIQPKLGLIHNATFAEDSMIQSLQSAAKTEHFIDQQILTEMTSLIGPASRGKLSAPVHRCYDAGVLGYFTFIQNQENKTYRAVLLYQTGDWAQMNLQKEAVELFGLLRRYVDNDSNPLPCAP